MSIQARQDQVHAAGSVSVAGAVVSPTGSGGARDWTVAGPVASVFTITMNAQLAAAERCILCGPRGVLDSLAVPALAGETAAAFTVLTGVANTGAAADRAFDFCVLRLN